MEVCHYSNSLFFKKNATEMCPLTFFVDSSICLIYSNDIRSMNLTKDFITKVLRHVQEVNAYY